jgi:heat-inducible transcriptional repressor
MFVDTLIQYKRPNDGDIRKLQEKVASSKDDTQSLVASVSDILSRITSLAGVVSVPKGRRTTLRQIEFLPLSDSRVLAILVINDREVQNRILYTEQNYSADELLRAANFINENYTGEELADIPKRLIKDLEATRDSMNQAMHDIISVAQSAMSGASSPKSAFVVTGEANLMNFAELSDLETLRRLFDAFQRKRMMIDLLDRSINASGVQIFIGEESGYQLLDDCSVVTAPYSVDEGRIGVLGVIGPTRMAYDRVVPIVEVTARMLGSVLKLRD